MTPIRLFILNLIFVLLTGLQAFANDYKVLGIGAPCMDILIETDEEFIKSIGSKGGSLQIDWHTVKVMLDHMNYRNTAIATGGSCANTIKGLAGFGHKCALYGRLGKDEMGHKFLDNFKQMGIVTLCSISKTSSTQICLCLISPDGERTMRCYPGASNDLSAKDLTPELFQGVSLVHIEGYALYVHDPEFVPAVMQMAKQHGALVSFDLSSFELVKIFKPKILELLQNYVDIIFANADEVKALTGLGPIPGCRALKEMCSIAVVMIGKDGCLVGSGPTEIHCPASTATVVDTTGAGDLFASGFLHGILQNFPLEECARFGNLAGAAVIEVYGAEIPPEKWNQLKVP